MSNSGAPSSAQRIFFPRHVTASARWLLSACESLDGVLAAEGIRSLPDPDEPGAALCRTARTVILAWRQPSGTSADRDITVVTNARGSDLDPSAAGMDGYSGKWGVDATAKPSLVERCVSATSWLAPATAEEEPSKNPVGQVLEAVSHPAIRPQKSASSSDRCPGPLHARHTRGSRE